MILAVSHPRDLHARAVLEALARRGAEASLLDLSDLPSRGRLALSYGGPGGLELRLDGRPAIEAEEVTALWWRRPQPPRAPARLGASRKAFAERQTLAAAVGWVASLGPRTLLVNHPWRDDVAGQKAFLLAAAGRAGLSLPETLITSDPEAARAFLSRRWREGAVQKALAATPADWRRTRRVGPRGAAGLPGLRHAPLILQRRVPGVDVRVILAGERLHAAEIDARRSTCPDDYRGHERTCRFTPCRPPAAVARGLRALMRDLGLLYGAADFRKGADGAWRFLELNPRGQWLFVEQRTGQPITAAVADLLAGRR